MKSSLLRKFGKSECSKLEKKCDALLTPIIKTIHPKCEACCSNDTFVAHHWIEKSRSNRLRYELDNLIGLCQSCHCKIHNKFGSSISGCLDVANAVIKVRGYKWLDNINKLSRETIKKDRLWYETNYARLVKYSHK